MSGEADEAGGLTPGHEENEVGRGFRPEKPYLPLSIEVTVRFADFRPFSPNHGVRRSLS